VGGRPARPTANTQVYGFPGRWWRIGELLPHVSDNQFGDKWWWLRVGEDYVPLAEEVVSALRTWGVPALRAELIAARLAVRPELLEQFKKGDTSALTEILEVGMGTKVVRSN
jgi:hypothetical protein